MRFSEKLIQDAIRGKEDAIEVLYNRTYSNVHYIISNFVKDTDDALDLIMNTYVSGFHNLHLLSDAAEFGDWIETIAQENVLTYLKKKSQEKYANITIEDIGSICELGLKDRNRSKIKPNQRLLELIENECVFYDDADDYDMGDVQEIIDQQRKKHQEKKLRKQELREEKKIRKQNKLNEDETEESDVLLKVIVVIAAIIAVAMIFAIVWIFVIKGTGKEKNSNSNGQSINVQKQTNSGQDAEPTPTRIPIGNAQKEETNASSNGADVTSTPPPTSTPIPTPTPAPVATPTPVPTVTPIIIYDDSANNQFDAGNANGAQDYIEYYDSEEHGQDNGYFEEFIVEEETFNY